MFKITFKRQLFPVVPIVGFLFVVFSLLPKIHCCPADYDKFEESCYQAGIQDFPFNQSAASDFCRKQGAQLASIHSEAEQQFVLGLVSKIATQRRTETRLWLGLRIDDDADQQQQQQQQKRCTWSDGSAFDFGECKMHVGNSSASSSPWAGDNGFKAEPNNAGGDEHCVNVGGRGWVDDDCSNGGRYHTAFGYLCKMHGGGKNFTSTSTPKPTDEDETRRSTNSTAFWIFGDNHTS